MLYDIQLFIHAIHTHFSFLEPSGIIDKEEKNILIENHLAFFHK